MSRDNWTKALRLAGSDASAVERLLAGGAPDDGLQHAGQAVLRCSPSATPAALATELIELLTRRNWTGDAALIAELEHLRDGTSQLKLLAVDLEELGEALDESPASESYIDLTNGTVWPGQLFEVEQGPDDFDADDSDRWLPVVGTGANNAYAAMEQFVATVDDPGLAARLHAAIKARSRPFRRFQTELSRHDDEYTRWHRFSDDANLGHARAWFADHGYRSTR